MHFEIPLVNKTLIITRPRVQLVPTRRQRALGWHSICEDNRHVLFFDYDDIWRTRMLQDLECLIQEFELSDFHVFATKKEEKIGVPGFEQLVGSYHAVCLDKFTPYEATKIIRSSHSDFAFKLGAILNTARCWTLRTHKDYREKPVFLFAVKSPYRKHQQSSAHAEFMNKHYGVHVELTNPDELSYVWLEEYNTKRKR